MLYYRVYCVFGECYNVECVLLFLVEDIISGPVSIDVGNELFVSCNVSTAGYNQDLFEIDWFIDGNKVDERNEHINITKQVSNYYIQSTLTIKHASKEDSGEYICSTTSQQMARHHIFILNGGKWISVKGLTQLSP